MTRIAALQIVGPAALGGGVLGAEGALHALAWAPASPLLWYLNLEVFSPFRRVQGFLGANIGNVDFVLSIFGLMLCVLAIGGYIFQRRLVLAIASNLSFMFATMLAVSLLFSNAPLGYWLSLAKFSPTEIFICFILLGLSFLSLTASHFTYLCAIRAER
jgi:hypothetical protein